MNFDPVQFFASNTEILFRTGLVMFILGVLLMLIDRDFNRKLEKNSFVAKVFTMRLPIKIDIKTDPYGSVIAFFGITIAFLALGLAPDITGL